MEKIFIKWLINIIAIMLAVKYVPGINYSGSWWGIFLVVLIFGLINSFIKPFVKFLTFPLLILSLGLFTFIINAMMLSITSWLSEQFGLGFSIEGFKPAFWGSLIISIVSMILSCLLPPNETGHRQKKA
jgi:putative membrane protein